jgi:hypothetical protein
MSGSRSIEAGAGGLTAVHIHGARVIACALAAWLAGCSGPDASPADARGADGGAGPDASGGGGCAVPSAPGQPVRVRPPQDFFDSDIFTPAVAVNDQGMGVIAWGEEIGDTQRVLATRLANGCWDAPAEIAAMNGLAGTAVIDADGNATVVWILRELDAPGGIAATSLWATRHENGAWQPAQRVSAAPPLDYTSYVHDPAVLVDGEGGVVVAWIQRADDGDGVAWNRLGPAGWGTPGVVASDRILGAETRIAALGPDQMVVIWREYSDILTNDHIVNVFSSRWTGVAWTAAELVGDPALAVYDSAERLHLVSRGAAGVTAVWEQRQGAIRSFGQNHYDAAMQTWTGATALPPVPDTAQNLALAGSEAGLVAAAWTVAEGDIDSAWAAHFTAGTGWSDAVLLEDSPITAGAPDIAMNDQGRALAIWPQSVPDGLLPQLWASGAPAAGAWSAAQGFAASPNRGSSIAISPAGYALIAMDIHDITTVPFTNSVTAILLPPETW